MNDWTLIGNILIRDEETLTRVNLPRFVDLTDAGDGLSLNRSEITTMIYALSQVESPSMNALYNALIIWRWRWDTILGREDTPRKIENPQAEAQICDGACHDGCMQTITGVEAWTVMGSDCDLFCSLECAAFDWGP